jgi:hypothetical protein
MQSLPVPTFRVRDLIASRNWRTAFFTTYSLSLSFFEAVVLHALRQAAVRRTSIAVDLDGYRSTLGERGASDAGRTYDLVPMLMPSAGIFHPKLMVLDGEAGPRVIVGSGNLTFRGWGGNIEVAEFLSPATAPGAFTDVADFLDRLSTAAGASAGLASERDAVPPGLAESCRAAARVQPASGDLRVLHSIDRPIADQVVEAADELGGASTLLVISPFLRLAAVQRLAVQLGCDDVSVCVPMNSPEQFDFAAARAAGLDAKAVTADAFQDADRPLHAKILELTCRRGRLTLSGSVNATTAAMMSTDNVELAVLRVNGRPGLLGWRACLEPAPATAPFAAGPPQPCLVARHEGAQISGRLLCVSQPQGFWHAAMDPADVGQAVDVDAEGRFAFPSRMDPLQLGRATQLTLFRDGVAATGWLVLEHVLSAVRERGHIAEAITRVLAGAGVANDIAAILAFFAENPEALAQTEVSASAERDRKIHVGASGMVDLNRLEPADAAISTGAWGLGAAGLSGFERLLESLRIRCDPRAPGSTAALRSQGGETLSSEEGVDDDPRDEDGDTAGIPASAVSRTLDSLFGRAAQAGSFGRELMRYVLGFIRFMSGHVAPDERDEFVTDSVGRWLNQAWSAAASAPAVAPDELDCIFAAVLTAKVLTGRMMPMNAHAKLQSWRGGLVGKGWVGPAMPDGDGPLEQWLAPGFGSKSWANAWRSMLSARTHWSWARRLADQLAAGATRPDLPPYATPDERQRICRAFASSDPKQRRTVIAIHDSRGNASCPRHGYVLPRSDAHRFRSARIARTECCGAVLLNLDLRHVPDPA